MKVESFKRITTSITKFSLSILIATLCFYFGALIAHAGEDTPLPNGLSFEDAIPLTIGETIYTRFNHTGGDTYYTFTLSQRGAVNIDMIDNFSGHQELYDENKNLIDSCPATGAENAHPRVGLAPGKYYLFVDCDTISSWTSIRVTFEPSDAWEMEINNTPETANEIGLGEQIHGSPNKYQRSEYDYYKFSVPNNGRLNIHWYNNSLSTVYEKISLYDIEQKQLFYRRISNDDGSGVSDLMLGVKAGEYLLKIESNSVYGRRNDEYSFSVDFTAADDWEQEFNETKSTATSIPLDQVINGSLMEETDIDNFTFTNNELCDVDIVLSHPELDTDNSCWKVTVSDQQHQLAEYTINGTTAETINTIEKLGSGKYYVQVKKSNNWSPTTYQLTAKRKAIEDPVVNFVTRLYNIGLGRTPDSGGLNDWTSKLKSGEKNAVDIVQGVLCSPEYNSKNKSSGDVVTDCYKAMLDRDPDSEGYNNWVSCLESGMSINAIFAGFVGSQEFATLCDQYGITPGTYTISEERDKNAGVTKFVSRLYTQALGREFDVDGLNDWCGQINRDSSKNNILNVSTNGFFHSQEFTNKNLNNTDFVKVLYRTFLGREYDDDGLADWVGKLDRGEQNRDQVMAGFAFSPEFNNIMAQYGLGQ